MVCDGAWGWDGTMASPTWDGDRIDGLGMGWGWHSPVQSSNDRAVRGSVVRGLLASDHMSIVLLLVASISTWF